MVERSTSRRALVLAGGGAKGAFQVGVVRELYEAGLRFASYWGVSVGALNAAALAYTSLDILEEIWLNVHESDVFKRFSRLQIGWRMLRGEDSVYDLSPLAKMLERYLPEHAVAAHAGVVSLETGEYESQPATRKSVFASSAIPGLFQAGDGIWCDGGVRNMTPLSDAIESGADEIMVVLCNQLNPEHAKKPANAIAALCRGLTLAMNEIARGDIRETARINDMLKQARGDFLPTKPDGSPYRYVPLTVIEPPEPLGGTLDFSQEMIRWRYEQGRAAARAVLNTLTRRS